METEKLRERIALLKEAYQSLKEKIHEYPSDSLEYQTVWKVLSFSKVRSICFW